MVWRTIIKLRNEEEASVGYLTKGLSGLVHPEYVSEEVCPAILKMPDATGRFSSV